MKYKIQKLKSVNNKILKELTSLINQLNPDFSPPLKKEDIENILSSKSSEIFIATDENDKIIGSISLCHYFQIEGRVKAWVEDLVVAKNHRRKGLATKLINKATSHAKLLGYQSIYLTSRPSRKGANKMYANLGFRKRNTNCYKKVL